MNKLITRAFLIGILFLFIYNPPVRFLPMNTGVIIGGIFFVLYLVEFLLKIDLKKQVPVNRNVLQVIGLTSLIIGYSFLVAIVSGSRDFQVFKSYLSFLLFYIPGAFGIIHHLKKYYNAKSIFKLVVFVTVIQAIIILAMFTSPAVKEFFFSLLRDSSTRADRNISSGGFRFLGFSFSTTWDLSVVQSIGIMSLALLFRIEKYEVNLKNALYFLLLSFSVVVSGRTGILGIVLGLILIIVPLRTNEIPFSSFFRFLFFLLIIIAPLSIFISSFIPPQISDIIENNLGPWAFEMFQNDTNGLLETRSSVELKSMYFVPSFWTTLFGDGYYINPADPTMYYMNTDAGYMRHLLFYGIIGCIILVSIYGVVFYQMFKFSRILDTSYIVKIYLFFLMVYAFISHMKGDFLLGADMPIKLIFFLYAMIINFYSSKDNRETDEIKG